MLFDPAKMGGMSTEDFIKAYQYYEACCTAEFLMDSCKSLFGEEEALEIGYEVRRRMAKADEYSGSLENEYLTEVICEMMEDPESEN